MENMDSDFGFCNAISIVQTRSARVRDQHELMTLGFWTATCPGLLAKELGNELEVEIMWGY
jgi:hypothetical protein